MEAIHHDYRTDRVSVKTLCRFFPETRRVTCALIAARYALRVLSEGLPVTADEVTERRKAQRHLRLLDLFEPIAIEAESATTDKLRAAYARRFRSAIGVPPIGRSAFREALLRRVNVPVSEIIAMYDGS